MYEIIDYATPNGMIIAIELDTGEIYSYDQVSFGEDYTLKFTYYIHSGPDEADDNLKNKMGDILVEMIEDSLKNKTTIFKGGV